MRQSRGGGFVQAATTASGRRLRRRRVWALAATITVERLISAAPTAGGRSGADEPFHGDRGRQRPDSPTSQPPTRRRGGRLNEATTPALTHETCLLYTSP